MAIQNTFLLQQEAQKGNDDHDTMRYIYKKQV